MVAVWGRHPVPALRSTRALHGDDRSPPEARAAATLPQAPRQLGPRHGDRGGYRGDSWRGEGIAVALGRVGVTVSTSRGAPRPTTPPRGEERSTPRPKLPRPQKAPTFPSPSITATTRPSQLCSDTFATSTAAWTSASTTPLRSSCRATPDGPGKAHSRSQTYSTPVCSLTTSPPFIRHRC